MKRACVIGAGVSGLPTIKSCIEEGLDVTCYEQSEYVGGLWRYRAEVEEDATSIFKNVVLNVSKEMMAYSDYPPPVEYPIYLRNHIYYEYLKSYCDHFNLRMHIKFRHKVLEVIKAEDYVSSGKWKVSVCDLQNREKVTAEVFDYVLVCSGHHIDSIVPSIPGQQEFKGKTLHSKEYRRPESFQGLKVVVVGFGNSACDIATDIGPCAKQTYLSTRHRGWLFPRFLEGKKILDHELFSRSFQMGYSFLPLSCLLSKYESMCNNVFDHKVCGLNPRHRIVSQRPVVNDVLPMQLVNGTVILKPGIKELQPNGVMFEGEDEVTEVDAICYATGFAPRYKFLKDMENADQYADKLYRLVFPAHLEHQTLAFIGLLDPNFSIAVCAELQARWVARVLSGKLSLPSRKRMLEHASKFQEMLKKTCYEGFSQKTNINGPPYLDDIAKDLKVKPSLLWLLITDPKLFHAVLFGPLCAYQFRIQGPHSWLGARAAILGLKDRAFFATKNSRDFKEHSTTSRNKVISCTLLSMVGIGCLTYILQFSKYDFSNIIRSK